jgi:hypothetical protein
MASTHKSLRSSTADKRPTTAIADGQIALNTNATSPGLFFKDSTGASIIKVGPVHVGSTAPNVSPAVGGSSGNSTGEVWLDNSLTPVGVKIWNGSAWVNATPAGSTTVQGLLELATDAETQAGSDTARAVTPASLQSKVSDSTSTTSATTIASSTAVKSAYDLAAAAVPASGGTVTGNLEIGNTGSLSFEGATADGFETTIAVTDPTADRTITLPDTTGTIVTTGDTGTVTSTMLLDGTIVNGDINASAAIAGTKISPDFGSQTITTTGVVSAALGAAATPSITFTGDLNTGIYSPGADQVAISTNGAARLYIASDGKVGLGTSSPSSELHVTGTTATDSGLTLQTTSNNAGDGPLIDFLRGAGNRIGTMRGGRDVSGGFLAFSTVPTTAGAALERLRIDSSGRLLVGTSTALTNIYTSATATTPQIQLSGSALAESSLSLLRTGTTGAAIFFNCGSSGNDAIINSVLGRQVFNGFDGTNYRTGGQITCEVDGTPGAGDMPGRLVFSTTADGASTPTERMRIRQDGSVNYNNDGTNPIVANKSTSTIFGASQTYAAIFSSYQDVVILADRKSTDGGVIAIRQDGVTEGTISVAGTTVTYGGGHLARWSQLPDNGDPSGILKGTVMSNLDEMCEWGEEENEQLNKTKVSDVEGDPNVAGVFVSTSFDEDGPLDFFVGMTGDMIIRIAEGVTVQRGDLLMSAGDGTAKPQDDDIIRSKTIAKVTSNHVTCTYDDGSYCVPCVLMAC